jgi:arylsulfatase A-like enzyme
VNIRRSSQSHHEELRLVHGAAVWLALVLIVIKASYLGLPAGFAPGPALEYVRSLAAISYADVVFAAVAWAGALVVLSLFEFLPPPFRRTWPIAIGFVALAACAVFAAAVNVGVFSVLGGFLTHSLLQMVGDVRMVRSSIDAHLTPAVVASLAGAPLAYVTVVCLTQRGRRSEGQRSTKAALIGVAAIAWVLYGHYAFSTHWANRQERRIAANAHWVFLASWWQSDADLDVRLPDRFAEGDLQDFEPIGLRAGPSRAGVGPAAPPGRARHGASRRPLNVIVVVLESVAARWTGLSGGGYETTPTLKTEAAHGIVFDNFYAHIGRSSNSLSALLLSAYPKLSFRDITQEYPDLPGTSVASLFQDRGYRTAFITPSALSWAGWDRFLDDRGFDEVRDERHLVCGERVSSWGVEDRCMVEDMVRWMDADARRPFFLMTWTQQTHHPYEPTPGVSMRRLVRDPVVDDDAFDRYLNVLRETDRHIATVFAALRRSGREKNTLVLVTGDHGQAFGYPHKSYMQGRTVYEEDVRVPLLIWLPRTYRRPVRSSVVGSHVDIAPTIADLAGMPPAPEWQGRSLFDRARPPRAYFYVAEDEFMLGVREERWKYVLNLRDGREELFDLDADPAEQTNLASLHSDICARLRQRLAAWTEANHRQYAPR